MRYVVNFAAGSWFPKGQERLVRSLREQKFKGRTLMTSRYPPGCPTHAESPYAFKFAMIQRIRRMGAHSVLWVDASIWAVAPVEPIFDLIEREGYAFWMAGWWTGQWCKDAALATLGVTREDALKIPMLVGGCFGLDLRNARSIEYLETMCRLSRDGVTFPGPWDNAGGAASPDPRVLGHRHDQTAASVIAHRMGFALRPPVEFQYWSEQQQPGAILVARGM